MTSLKQFYANPDLADGFGATKGRVRPHGGLDFPHASGASIPALFSGEVVEKGVSAELGCYIQIRSGNGKVFTYCHSENPSSLALGSWVRQGATVNLVGARGYATGPHLHLAVAKILNSRNVGFDFAEDPWPWVQRALRGEDLGGDPATPAAPAAGWAFNTPNAATQKRIQQALKNRGRYSGAVDGVWGPNSIKGIQTTIKNVGYTGPIDGVAGSNTCYYVQVYAQKFGDYKGPVDRVLGPNSWNGFALGLERP